MLNVILYLDKANKSNSEAYKFPKEKSKCMSSNFDKGTHLTLKLHQVQLPEEEEKCKNTKRYGLAFCCNKKDVIENSSSLTSWAKSHLYNSTMGDSQTFFFKSHLKHIDLKLLSPLDRPELAG